jgi:hypothetical protein
LNVMVKSGKHTARLTLKRNRIWKKLNSRIIEH